MKAVSKTDKWSMEEFLLWCMLGSSDKLNPKKTQKHIYVQILQVDKTYDRNLRQFEWPIYERANLYHAFNGKHVPKHRHYDINSYFGKFK